MHPRRSLPGPRHSRRRNQGSDEKSPVGRFRDDDPGPLGQGRRCCQQEMAVHGYGGLEGESCLIQKGPFPFRVSALTPSHFPSIRRSPRPCITAFASSSSRFFLRLCVFSLVCIRKSRERSKDRCIISFHLSIRISCV